MAVETCDQRRKRYKKKLDYILEEVLDQEEISDIHKALVKHECKTIIDVISSTDSEFNTLGFKDDSDDVVVLKKYELSKDLSSWIFL